jgi:hypothetical protein
MRADTRHAPGLSRFLAAGYRAFFVVSGVRIHGATRGRLPTTLSHVEVPAWTVASLVRLADWHLLFLLADKRPSRAVYPPASHLRRRAGVEMGVDGELRSERPDLDVLA